MRAIEIRPDDDQGPQDHAPRDRLSRAERAGRAAGGFGLPTPFMEWAVGKQGEMMRPDTGKLLLPGLEVPLGHPLLAGR